MKYPTLPQVCCRCHKLKSPDQGRFIKSRHKYGRWLWLCSTCDQHTVTREHRHGRESHYEKIVREALQAVFPHLDIKSEHQVGPYLFDFAVNDLRLLIEIDPFSTHSAVGRKIRDWKKAKLAREKGWSLVRLSPYPPRKLTARAISAVRQRYKKLFPDTRWPNTPAKEHPKNEATVDGFIKRWDLFFEYRFGFQPQFRTGDVEALETFLDLKQANSEPERPRNSFSISFDLVRI